MIKTLKNKLAVVSAFIMSLVFVVTGAVHAAVDADFTNTTASSTGMMTDYKTPILVFLVAIFGIYLAIKLGKIALRKAVGMIAGAFKH